jgi:nicotinate-nucleotide pyrophosphorylase (carboxylating)
MTAEPLLTAEQREALLARTRTLVELAREEDLGAGDLSAALMPPEERGHFRLVARQPGVFAGREIGATILAAYDPSLTLRWMDNAVDGARIAEAPLDLADILGPVPALLSAERVFLNFFQRLSGIATLTRRFVDAVAGTGAKILDTRKTTPGWRLLEKYAVRCGGGTNHRFGLYDAIMLKDNHIAGAGPERIAGAVFDMLAMASRLPHRPRFIEVEADTLDQAEQLFSVVGVDVILLDNFALGDMRKAVELRDALNLRGKVTLEASGGIILDTVADIARTGVDWISVGALTHSAPSLDLSLERVS